jgi:hypothetical protein
MGDFAVKSDGRRIFTVEFKRGIVEQLVKGDKTLAEVSRELDIQPSVRTRPKGFDARAPCTPLAAKRFHVFCNEGVPFLVEVGVENPLSLIHKTEPTRHYDK